MSTAQLPDNDPYFAAMQAEMDGKGFLVTGSDAYQLGPLWVIDVDDLRLGLLRDRDDACFDAQI